MALISLRQLLDYAAEHEFGVPSFNVNNMEQVHTIMQAAVAADEFRTVFRGTSERSVVLSFHHGSGSPIVRTG